MAAGSLHFCFLRFCRLKVVCKSYRKFWLVQSSADGIEINFAETKKWNLVKIKIPATKLAWENFYGYFKSDLFSIYMLTLCIFGLVLID
jgi:hypothetical protein